MGKTEKNQKENHKTKVTKIPKTKRQKYGMKGTKQEFQQNSSSHIKKYLRQNSNVKNAYH